MKSGCSLWFSLVILLAPGGARTDAQTSWYSYVGNPVLRGALEPSVLYDSTSQIYRMWFIKLGTGILDAQSPDGLNWFIGDSVVLRPGTGGAFDLNIHALSVIKTGGQFVMYYTASRDAQSLAIGRAVSADGRHWQKGPSTPVLSPGNAGAWDSRSVAGGKVVGPDQGLYRMWFGGSDGVQGATGLATSFDGIVWTKAPGNPVLTRGVAGAFDAVEAGVMAVAKRESVYYMIYRGIDATQQMAFALATSSNGSTWWKYPGNPVKWPLASWDYSLIGSGTLLWINGRFDLWYSGSDGYQWGIGVAMDTFVPLAVEEHGGRELSSPLLMQNYPNPFNPNTVIHYQVATEDVVTLRVYDLLGREVALLVNERQGPGRYSVQFAAEGLASGVYVYRLTAGGFVQTRKMILAR